MNRHKLAIESYNDDGSSTSSIGKSSAAAVPQEQSQQAKGLIGARYAIETSSLFVVAFQSLCISTQKQKQEAE